MNTNAPLRRSREHKKVGGVIGGIAEYFDKNPMLLRVIYVIASILSAAFPARSSISCSGS